MAVCAALTLGGCIGYDGDFDRGYQVDDQAISQIKVGATTKPEALALLGTPSTTSTVGGDAWYYIGQKMKHTLEFMPVQMTDQHVLAVYFDKGGKVDRIANYGMQGRQGVRLRQPHHPDRRLRARLPQEHDGRPVQVQLSQGAHRRSRLGFFVHAPPTAGVRIARPPASGPALRFRRLATSGMTSRPRLWRPNAG